MIPEIGLFALILSLGLSILVSIYPLYGISAGNKNMMRMARPLTYGIFFMLLVSYLILTWEFYVNDFTVEYVASNSASLLPWYYRLTAVWASHQGSLMLWALMQATWAAAVARFSRNMTLESVSRVLAVLGMIGTCFLVFIIFTSNPFLRTLPLFPVNGRDLNPLLQDPGLIFHPPTLYMGYVGLSVAFAFAVASLLSGRLDTAWARWSRPWTTAAWAFLTLGIVFGSWWAYYELGWGGWWFWDPVENASLMPWLVATALMHSLAVSEKRGSFKAWTVLLSILGFSLSLLGTFLVRSGIIVSVHSFASDPTRGLYILSFLLVVIGGSLLLYALRGAKIRSQGNYSLFSRENMLLANNIFLIAALLIVFIGTLLPLVHKLLGLGAISVGAPFFNLMFVWIMVPFSFFLGIGPLVRWRRDSLKTLRAPLIGGAIATLILSFVLLKLFAPEIKPLALLGMIMALWVIIMQIIEVVMRASYKQNFSVGIKKLGRSHWAMVFGHIGLAVTIIGITLVSNYSVEQSYRMSPGQTVNVGGYDFQFAGVRTANGPNYQGYFGDFYITRNDVYVTTLHAEKRFYTIQRSMMTEASVDSGITRDLYIAMGEQLKDGGWAVRIYFKPFVNWIWWGGLLMAVGAICSLSDKRYRYGISKKKRVKVDHE